MDIIEIILKTLGGINKSLSASSLRSLSGSLTNRLLGITEKQIFLQIREKGGLGTLPSPMDPRYTVGGEGRQILFSVGSLGANPPFSLEDPCNPREKGELDPPSPIDLSERYRGRGFNHFFLLISRD